ncbi:MAG: hypothetical protein ACE5KQ_04200 [Thermoplasmata archaeon]
MSEGTFGELRVIRIGAFGPNFLFENLVLLLITPVLAIEAVPLALPIHILAISLLYAFALDRLPRMGGSARLAILVGLAFALTAPFPGLYPYPNPFPSLIALIPGSLIPIVSFFAEPLVRYGFILVAYGLPIVALVVARPEDRVKPLPETTRSSLPAYLLPTLMFVGLLLIVLGTDRMKVIGLIWNWALLVAALLLWALYYRPALTTLRVPPGPTAVERRLTAWRRPTLVFGALTILVLLLTSLPPVDEFVESSALGHHAQHVALLLLGFLMGGLILQQARAYRRERSLTGEVARFVYTSNVLYNPHGAVGVSFAVVAVALWHVPFFWDLALMYDAVHVVEHFFLIAAGSAVAFSLGLMPAGRKYAFLVGATMLMSLLALTLWFTAVPVYATYSVAQLSALGMVHFLLGMPLMVFAIGITVVAVLKMNRIAGDGAIRSS